MKQFNSPTAKARFWHLSIRHVLLLVSIFAVLSAVWGYRLREAERAEAVIRAAHKAMHDARQLNIELDKAVRAMDRESVDRCLQAGASPNIYDGSLPLAIAIGNGDVDNVKLLLAAGASVDAVERAGPPASLLEDAIRSPVELSRKLLIMRELLDHGAVANQGARDAGFGSKSIEIMELLRQFDAAYGPREMTLAGDMHGLRAALETDPGLFVRPLTKYCGSSKSLLGVALCQGHEELATWMLDQGAPLEVHEISDASAIHLAVVGNCAGIMQRLCSMGSDPNAQDDGGDTPLDYCGATTSPETIKALVDCGADLNRLHPAFGDTVLHRAIRRFDSANGSNSYRASALELIRLLLDAGAEADMPDANGQTARDLARSLSPALADLFD